MFINILLCILFLLSALKGICYGIYEKKQNNKIAGNAAILLSILSFILPSILLFIY